jgi:hypothetical protein
MGCTHSVPVDSGANAVVDAGGAPSSKPGGPGPKGSKPPVYPGKNAKGAGDGKMISFRIPTAQFSYCTVLPPSCRRQRVFPPASRLTNSFLRLSPFRFLGLAVLCLLLDNPNRIGRVQQHVGDARRHDDVGQRRQPGTVRFVRERGVDARRRAVRGRVGRELRERERERQERGRPEEERQEARALDERHRAGRDDRGAPGGRGATAERRPH